MQEHFKSRGFKVIGLVSDRAKALVKLGQSAYLNACSMPDFFHFQQDIGKLGGLKIGKKHQKTQRATLALNEQSPKKEASEKERIVKQAVDIAAVYQDYRKESATINKTIHPFDESNNWVESAVVNKKLIESVRKVGQLVEQLDMKVDLNRATKILDQIPDIVKGIKTWVSISQAKIDAWVDQNIISETEKLWLSNYLLPALYWQLQTRRTKNGRSNPDLVQYYEHKSEQAQHAALGEMKTLQISTDRGNCLFELANQMAASFQRSSSQVEGRNGYLAFIHHGQKGIPKQKMKALTVVHNFDTKRADGSTPAQRLFRQDFPDLFEFLYLNVTGFKEPRKRKHKTLNNRFLQL